MQRKGKAGAWGVGLLAMAAWVAGCGAAPVPGGWAGAAPAEAGRSQARGLAYGLEAPLPQRRLQQAAAGPMGWGFEFQRTWQREDYVRWVEPATPKYHYLSGEIIGWWPEKSGYARRVVNGADYQAPGLDGLTHLSSNRFLLKVPAGRVWVLTEVLRPEAISINGIVLAKARQMMPGQETQVQTAIETPTAVRILAGPNQQVILALGEGSVMHGFFDDPANYGKAFLAEGK